MTESVVVQTDLRDSAQAGKDLGERVLDALKGQSPDALLVFAAPDYDYGTLLRGIQNSARPETMVGGSSIGGFTKLGYLESCVSAIAIRSTDMRFTAAVGTNMRANRAKCARELVSSFCGLKDHTYLSRGAFVLFDYRVDNADDFVDELILQTSGMHQIFGGGASADFQLTQSHVFVGTQVLSDAAVALEVLSNKPIGVSICETWKPVSPPLKVTEAKGRRLFSLNSIPIVEVFQELAETTGQSFDPAAPFPFFLANILAIETQGGRKMRAPLLAHEDGSVTFVTEIPSDAVVRLMTTNRELAAEGAYRALAETRAQLQNHEPGLMLMFDCMTSQLRVEMGFGFDLQTLNQELSGSAYTGVRTCGQVVRAEGQYNGFHNSTAVMCLLPS